MNATFFCENTLCALNGNRICIVLRNPLKCVFREKFLKYGEDICYECVEKEKCDDCEFHPDGV